MSPSTRRPASSGPAGSGARRSPGSGRASGSSGSGSARSAGPARAPGSTRPTARAGARPPTSPRPRPASSPTERQSRLFRRGGILAVIVVVLAVMLVPTVRSLVRQRAEISTLRSTIAAQQQSVTDLQAENARWQDPVYVEQQARERLKFVRPGDKSYSVIDPSTSPTAPSAPAGASVAAPNADSSASWYGRMWQSVQLADRPTAGLTATR